MDRFQDRASKYFRSATSKWWWHTPPSGPLLGETLHSTNAASAQTVMNLTPSEAAAIGSGSVNCLSLNITEQLPPSLQVSGIEDDDEDGDEVLDDVVDLLSPEGVDGSNFLQNEDNCLADIHQHHHHQHQQQQQQQHVHSVGGAHHKQYHRHSFHRRQSPAVNGRKWSRQFSLDHDIHSSHSPVYHDTRHWDGVTGYDYDLEPVAQDTPVYTQHDAFSPITDYGYRSRRPVMARSNTEPESQSFDFSHYSPSSHYPMPRYPKTSLGHELQHPVPHHHSSAHSHQWRTVTNHAHHYRPPNPLFPTGNSSSASSLLLMMMSPNGGPAPVTGSNSSADASPSRASLSRTSSRTSAGSYSISQQHHPHHQQKRLLSNRNCRLPMLFTSQSVDETCSSLNAPPGHSPLDESVEEIDSLMKRASATAAIANHRSSGARRAPRRWHQPLACSFSVDLPETRPSLLISSPSSPSPPHLSMNALRSGSDSVSGSASPSDSNCRISPLFNRRARIQRQSNTMHLTRHFEGMSLSPVENGSDYHNRVWANNNSNLGGSGTRLLPGCNTPSSVGPARQLPTIKSLPVIANNTVSPVEHHSAHAHHQQQQQHSHLHLCQHSHLLDASRSSSPQDYVQHSQLYVPNMTPTPTPINYSSLSNEALNLSGNVYHSAAQSPSHPYSATSPSVYNNRFRKQFSLDSSDVCDSHGGDYFKSPQLRQRPKRVYAVPPDSWRKNFILEKSFDLNTHNNNNGSSGMSKIGENERALMKDCDEEPLIVDSVLELKLNKFAKDDYDPDAEQERREDYARLGYFPAQMFDVVNNRYSLICKIGWGQFSTVWLAWDVQNCIFVAIKIVRAETNYYQSAVEEILNLEKIAARSHEASTDPGPSHLIQLLDNFGIRSVNGIHKCLVFEIMGKNCWEILTKTDFEGIPLTNVQTIMKQILEGVDFLHNTCRLIHSDLKPENILLVGGQEDAKVLAFKALYLYHRNQLPDSKRANAPEQVFFEENLFRSTGCVEEKQSLPVTVNSVKLFESNSLPVEHPVKMSAFDGRPYPEFVCDIFNDVITSVNANETFESSTPSFARNVVPPNELNIKIADLGSSYQLQRYYGIYIQTRQYRAPEVILDAGFDEQADIWSVGCVAYELATGDFLFNPKCQRGHKNRDMEQLASIQEVLGELPDRLVRCASKYRDIFLTRAFPIKLVSTSLKELLMKKNWTEKISEQFVDFLQPMLELDPDRRASASDMLKHPFLCGNFDHN